MRLARKSHIFHFYYLLQETYITEILWIKYQFRE